MRGKTGTQVGLNPPSVAFTYRGNDRACSD
jgi:hypothetical protein